MFSVYFSYFFVCPDGCLFQNFIPHSGFSVTDGNPTGSQFCNKGFHCSFVAGDRYYYNCLVFTIGCKLLTQGMWLFTNGRDIHNSLQIKSNKNTFQKIIHNLKKLLTKAMNSLTKRRSKSRMTRIGWEKKLLSGFCFGNNRRCLVSKIIYTAERRDICSDIRCDFCLALPAVVF